MRGMSRVFFIGIIVALLANSAIAQVATIVLKPDNSRVNSYYVSNRNPLTQQPFAKLPVGAVKPGGWLKKQLELQRDGLTGHLGEISIWLSKNDNAWLSEEGKGKYGWEELPYWLKGYGDIAYILQDKRMLAGTKFWIDAVLKYQRPDGDFGPVIYKKPGKRDLWANMPMLWCLQSYYEYSKDARVISFMRKYFQWELTIPDEDFLTDYWENSRGGDNLVSVYWLYNRTGDKSLLELATKIDRATANWRQANNLPNWHNVNVAECFREPATYYQQSHLETDLDATYNDFKLIRNIYGQVPGGMFGADENARKGYTDPHQAVETCGMVEQMTSDEFLLQFTGDTFWADNCEDVAFNTFPAAFTPDYKALRYLTAPNMVVSDSKNHSPGIANNGPFLTMNPFSSRCCQHNHSAGWVYYDENSWMATPDNGLATQLYTEGEVIAKVGNGTKVIIAEHTHYPFQSSVNFIVNTAKAVTFPVYLRVPAWCLDASVSINGKNIRVAATPDGYIKLSNKWKNGDRINLELPMHIQVREWTQNKNSVSVNYGPLTFSLKIAENYVKTDGETAVQGDSGWQATADQSKWPAFNIYPASAWNYGLLLDKQHPENSFSIIKKPWPKNNNPFTNAGAPIQLIAKGRQIADWQIDENGLCGVLPQSPVASAQPESNLTLVPMGGARLRISAFPVIEQ
jgi:hypothetical protein